MSVSLDVHDSVNSQEAKVPSSLGNSLLPPSEDVSMPAQYAGSEFETFKKPEPRHDKDSATRTSFLATVYTDAGQPKEARAEMSTLQDSNEGNRSTKSRPTPLQLYTSQSQPATYDPFDRKHSPLFSLSASPRNSFPPRRIKSATTPRFQMRDKQVLAPREKRRRMTDEQQSELYEAVSIIATSGPSTKFSKPANAITATADPKVAETAHSLTLWGYLLLELASQRNELVTREKTEQLVNFIKVPAHLEKVIIFGTLTCLDSFLYFFTILPLRFVYALYSLCRNARSEIHLPTSRKGDVIRGLIFVLVLALLLQMDTSRIYHNIRGQAAVKLYVMFNVLEIADKLFSALGQDILECLFSHETLDRHYEGRLSKYGRPALFCALAIIYIYFHSVVILYQIIALNVAVNSYSNALLTLLLSNQFSEIKSAVFKKFERENLFQVTCADVTERFQLTTMLFIIGMRNIVEVNNAGLVPRSWSGWNRWFGALFGPMFVFVGSEICVDWLKHAYIAKFNNIQPNVYKKFLDVLTYDYSENAFSGYMVTKRVGIPIFPLAVVLVRMLLQSYGMILSNQTPKVIQAAAATALMRPNNTDLAINHPGTSEAPFFILHFFNTGLTAFQSIPITWDTFFSYLLLTLVSVIAFLLLCAVKLILGLLLLEYSSKRCSKLARAYKKPPEPNSEHVAVNLTRASTNAGSNKSRSSVSHLRDSKKPPYTDNHAKDELDDDMDFVPGPLKGGQGLVEIPENLRQRLYEPEERAPPLKQRKSKMKDFRDLLDVHRFKMTSKQIW